MTIINGTAKTHAAAESLLTKLIDSTPWEHLSHEEHFLASELFQILYDHWKATEEKPE
jgi:hypothetical protein